MLPPEVDERKFKAWFWRRKLRRYRQEHPGAKKLPENSGEFSDTIRDAREAYVAGFKAALRVILR